MARLEDLTRGAQVKGIRTDGPVEVVDVKWHGTAAIELTYKDAQGKPGNELLYRDREATARSRGQRPRLELRRRRRPLPPRLRGPPHPARLPLRPAPGRPHLPRRAAAAPDPGRLRRDAARASRCASCWPTTPAPARRSWPACFIKELLIRGDLKRCLIVCPGNLAEQWQDELHEQVPPALRDPDQRQARVGPHRQLVRTRTTCVIAASTSSAATRTSRPSWRRPTGTSSSATRPTRCRRTFFGGEVKETKRYQLGQLARPAHPPLPADDGDAAQRQGGGLPALHGAARRRPLRGQVPRRRPHRRRLRPDAPPGQGAAAQVRRHAALPGAPRLHRQLQALRRRGRPLQERHRLRPRGVEPRRRAGERRPQGHGRLRADHPAAPARLLARGHLPVAPAPPRAPGEAPARGAAAQARRAGPARPAADAAHAHRRRPRRPRRRARRRGRGDRGAGRRPGHRRPDHRRARGRDRDPAAPRGAGADEVRRSGTDRKWEELSQPPPGRRRDVRRPRRTAASSSSSPSTATR